MNMPEREKDSNKKIRELASEIVNQLLKSSEPLRVSVGTAGETDKYGPKFGNCGDYECISKSKCQHPSSFTCQNTFKDSADYTMALG